MNVVLLTTDTTHHAYFAWKIAERFPLQAIVLERWRPAARFETCHPFELERDDYERRTLLAGGPQTCLALDRVHDCERVNDGATVAMIEALTPDVILVFGTGVIVPEVFRCARLACLNLHGGNPEEYRGLDSHLWTIYHRDFDNLVTTLHCVDAELDNGDIVLQGSLPIPPHAPLHQLRAINTAVCLELSLQALAELQRDGSVATRKQARRGRYYSHMPACLKQECVSKFHTYTARL